jgi:hypothetical protein
VGDDGKDDAASSYLTSGAMVPPLESIFRS